MEPPMKEGAGGFGSAGVIGFAPFGDREADLVNERGQELVDGGVTEEFGGRKPAVFWVGGDIGRGGK